MYRIKFQDFPRDATCQYMDPRFKNLTLFEPDEKDDVKTKAKEMALEIVSKLKKGDVLAKARQDTVEAAKEAARRAAAAVEEARKAAEAAGDITLAEWGPRPPKPSRVPKKSKSPKQAEVVLGEGAAQASDEEKGWEPCDLYAEDEPSPGQSAPQQTLSLAKLLRKEWEAYEKHDKASIGDDPIHWWRDELRSGRLAAPHLGLLARACFGIPGSTAAVERAFSHAGRFMGPRRARLSVEHACAMLFVHENIIRSRI
jgi:hypothetical protein